VTLVKTVICIIGIGLYIMAASNPDILKRSPQTEEVISTEEEPNV